MRAWGWYLTFAPCALTFAPCTCGVSFLSTNASTPLANMVVATGCNLRWWRFFFSHWHKHSLHWWLCYWLQLALVVVFIPPTGAHTLFALEQLALCGGIYTYIYIYVYIYIYIYIYYLTPLVSIQVTLLPSSTPPPPSSLSTLFSLMYNRQQGGMDNNG